jgi:hypothetical protein
MAYSLRQFMSDFVHGVKVAFILGPDLYKKAKAVDGAMTDAGTVVGNYSTKIDNIAKDQKKGKILKGAEMTIETIVAVGDLGNAVKPYWPTITQPFPPIPTRPIVTPTPGPAAKKPGTGKPAASAPTGGTGPTASTSGPTAPPPTAPNPTNVPFSGGYGSQPYVSVPSTAGSGLEAKISQDYFPPRPKSTGDPEKDYLLKCSGFVGSLYNNGRRPKEIIKYARGQGFDIKGRDEIYGLIAENIANGGTYKRRNYNSKVAESLQLNDYIVQSKLSGKSYSEIRDDVEKVTNGMSISRSTIGRMMRDYHQKQAVSVAQSYARSAQA